jgi:hypothetical protein
MRGELDGGALSSGKSRPTVGRSKGGSSKPDPSKVTSFQACRKCERETPGCLCALQCCPSTELSAAKQPSRFATLCRALPSRPKIHAPQIRRSMKCRAPVVFATLLPAILVASADATDAAEEPSRMTLDWSATPECVSQSRVLEAVDRLLGLRLNAPDSNHPVAARVRLEQRDDGSWHIVLTMQSESRVRTRTFDAESCEAAAAGVAFILAVAEDPCGRVEPACRRATGTGRFGARTTPRGSVPPCSRNRARPPTTVRIRRCDAHFER